MPELRGVTTSVVGVLGCGAIAGGGVASAVAADPVCTPSGARTVCTFGSAAAHEFAVPAGVSSLEVELLGGRGGDLGDAFGSAFVAGGSGAGGSSTTGSATGDAVEQGTNEGGGEVVMTYATPAPAQDSVRGSGTIAWGNSFVFDAQAAPDGSTPGGAVSFTDPSRGRTVQGGVVCLRVRGGRATIVYEDVATPAGLPGAGGTVRVLDSPEGDRQATAV